MAAADSSKPRFVVTDPAVDIETLVVGFTEHGLAGLTAVDYRCDRFEMRHTGHLAAGPLEAFAATTEAQYRALAERIGGRPGDTRAPDVSVARRQSVQKIATVSHGWGYHDKYTDYFYKTKEILRG